MNFRFGSSLAPLSVRLITSRHYLSEHGIKNGGTSGGTNGDEKLRVSMQALELQQLLS